MARILQEHFYLAQILLGAAFIMIAWLFFRPRPPESNFRVREADLKRYGKPKPGKRDELAEARIPNKLSLPGIRVDGAPHEILGVTQNASESEIGKAYRELMKRYHPDAVGRPGTREWNDAQKISEAINRAKEELLKRVKRKS